ncbi:MAG: lactate dehydrogenase [Pseudonocardiales bacterium]|nr:MAG: lactate dehydrogenase [Pseudonocardiales bacterium]
MITSTDGQLAATIASRIFEAVGVSAPSARTVAEALLDADRRGIASHGLLLVPMYTARLRAGSVSTHDAAEVIRDSHAVAVLDANHALGQLTADQAMTMAISKAAEFGVGIVTVRHAFHFGGAYRYVEAATRAGCIGIAAANTRPLMPAPGGATRVVGNNPMAIGVPRPSGSPLVLDMAMSEAALGKIRLAAQQERPIPSSWATDPAGRPTTNAEAAIAGMLLPIAGPKGYGLALMLDLLTGALSGGSSGAAVAGLYADTAIPNDCAHTFIAIDPGLFSDATEFGGRVEAVIAQVEASDLAPGTDRIYLPGQREQQHANLPLQIPVEVREALTNTAAEVGACLPDGWDQ